MGTKYTINLNEPFVRFLSFDKKQKNGASFQNFVVHKGHVVNARSSSAKLVSKGCWTLKFEECFSSAVGQLLTVDS